MYAPSVTARDVAAAEARLGRKLPLRSVEEVEFFNKHFESITVRDKAGEAVGFARDLFPDELEYIEGERILFKLDFLYAATRYFFISDKTNKVVRFSPNVAQKIALDVMGTLEALCVAIILMFLKARQLGVSTLSELLVLHRVISTPGVKAIIGSSDPVRSDKMSQMLLLAYKLIPWWLKPALTRYSQGEFFEFGEGEAMRRLDIQWGNKKTGIGRGSTPTVGHLSELCEFENAEELVDASLVRAMHEDPAMLFVAESTANGPGNWWHRTWEDSVAGLADGTNYYHPIFLPWYVGRDLYPTEARLRRVPVPAGWVPPENIRKHAEAAEEYVRTNPLLRKYLGEDWEMPVEQQWYYHTEYQRYKRKGKLSDWYKEMPATDLEAFTSAHGGLVDTERLIQLQDSVRPVRAVYAIEGPEISLRVPPSEFAPRAREEALAVAVNWSRQYRPAVYRFVPLRYTGSSGYDFNNKLVVWEEPREGEEYVVGVDTSHGKEKDASVVSVQRRWTPARLYDEQTAVFASNAVSSAYLWPFAMAVGTWLATLAGRLPCESKRQPMFAPEIPLGEAVIAEMKKRGWWHFYKRVARDQMKVDLAGANKLGFSTDRHSRHYLMDEFLKAVLEGVFRVNSLVTLSETSTLIWNPVTHRLEAQPGCHDDHFFAPAIGHIASRQFEQAGSRHNLYAQREERKAEEEAEPEFDPGDFGRIVVSGDVRRW